MGKSNKQQKNFVLPKFTSKWFIFSHELFNFSSSKPIRGSTDIAFDDCYNLKLEKTKKKYFSDCFIYNQK